MSETDGSLDADAITQIRDAAARLRTTATWTAGAVAAVGTTVGGAITFDGLKDLDGWNFVIGAVGLGVVVAAAVAVIALVAGILAPTDTQLGQLRDGSVKGVNAEMLLGASTLATFATTVDAAEIAYLGAMQPPAVGAAISGPSLDGLRNRATAYGERAERIRLIAHFQELRKRWRETLVPIVALALIGAGGVVAYQYASSRQRVTNVAQSALGAQLPQIAKAPDLNVTFATGALGRGVAAQCAQVRRAVEVPGQSKGQRGLLLRPKGRCDGLFVRVAAASIKSAPVALVRMP